MTKAKMFETIFETYVEYQNAYTDSKELADMVDDENMVRMFKRQAREAWESAYTIELLAKKLYPTLNLFDMYIETL